MELQKFGKKQATTPLGEAIRKLRVQTLTSQELFGAECGVVPRTVSLWEQGKAVPTPAHAQAIITTADEYQVSFEYVDSFMSEYVTKAEI